MIGITESQDFSSSPPPPPISDFIPTILPNLGLWLDGADMTTQTVISGRVSVWADKGPEAHMIKENTHVKRPQTGVDKLNGLNVLTLNGAQRMVIPAGLYDVPMGNNTIFVVSRRTTETQKAVRIFSLTKTASLRYHLDYSSSAGEMSFQNSSNYGGVYSKGNTNTDYQIIRGRRSGTEHSLAVNGGTPVTNLRANDGTEVNEGSLFSYYGVIQLLVGNVAEIILCRRDLLSQKSDQVQTYLSGKWGIPLS